MGISRSRTKKVESDGPWGLLGETTFDKHPLEETPKISGGGRRVVEGRLGDVWSITLHTTGMIHGL